MTGKLVATLDDKHGKLQVEVRLSNGWFFSRYRYNAKEEWRNTPKPYKHVLGAIRGAYYYGTGKI